MCVSVSVCVMDSIREKKVEGATEEKSGGKEKRKKWGGGKDGGEMWSGIWVWISVLEG